MLVRNYNHNQPVRFSSTHISTVPDSLLCKTNHAYDNNYSINSWAPLRSYAVNLVCSASNVLMLVLYKGEQVI